MRSAAGGTPSEECEAEMDSRIEEELRVLMGEVLGIATVGLHDHFFRLGGTSLSALKMLSRINGRFGAGLRLTDFLKGATVAELAARIRRSRECSAARPVRPVTRAGNGRVPATEEQANLWISNQIVPDPTAYNVPTAVRLRGPVDAGRLERALGTLCRRQDILRTQFRIDEGGVLQEVVSIEGPLLIVEDLQGVPEETRESVLSERLAAIARFRFDLGRAPLWRIRLLRMGPDDQVLVTVLHHILVDEWSEHLLLTEWEQAYREDAGEPVTWAELPVRFGDFGVWESERMAEADPAVHQAYWGRVLAGVANATSLPSDLPTPQRRTGAGGRISAGLDIEVCRRIRNLAREESTSSFVVALAAWQAWMAVRSGVREVVTGSPVALREQSGVEGLVGLFLRTLPIRATVDPRQELRPLIRQMRGRVADAFDHVAAPLTRILQSLHREPGSLSLFPTGFALVDREPAMLRLPGTTSEPVPVHTGTAKFELFLHCSTLDSGGWILDLEYAADRFSPGRAAEILSGFIDFLTTASASPDAPGFGRLQEAADPEPSELPFVDGLPANVMELLEAVSSAHPSDVAVAGVHGTLSAGELRKRYDRIASVLVAHGIRPGEAVALCVGRSLSQLEAILGVIKSGGVCFPIDPSHPVARRARILEDARPRIALTDAAHATVLQDCGIPVLVLDEIGAEPASSPVPACPAGPADPVYLLFTSGSTGRPKGVTLPHRALVNLVGWQRRTSILRPGDATLQFAPITFDVSFQEIFATLVQRGTLVLITEDERLDPNRLLETVRDQRVRRLILPFVALQQVAEAAQGTGLVPDTLREVFTSGEALRVTPVISEFFSRLPGCRFCNQYGPTETHVVTEHVLAGDPAGWPLLPPIGRPIHGVRIRIVDEEGRPVPSGTEGELLLGGECLALGYWNRPELTAERFVESPHDPAERWYRTGDCVLEGPSGELEFRGRSDDQVKVNGFRVELAEVETVLERHPALRQAAAAVRPGPSGLQRLVAWFVSEEPVSSGALAAHLRMSLPGYMIPSAFVRVDTMPRTRSGKLDRRALPDPDPAALPVAVAPVPPSTATEVALMEIWREVLGTAAFGVDESLFSIGGDSLTAMKIVARVRRKFSFDLSFADVMAHPTLAALARLVDGGGPATASIPRVTRPGDPAIPATGEQVNLWLAHQSARSPSAYSVGIVTRVLGPLDPALLERAWRDVLERQDVLQTRIRQDGSDLIQELAGIPEPVLERVDLGGTPPGSLEGVLEDRLREVWGAGLDPSAAPLWRFHVFRCSATDHVLALTVHHLLMDAASLHILADDLNRAYRAAAGEDVRFPDLPIRFADYAVWRRGRGGESDLARHEAYWRRCLSGSFGPIPLPTDLPAEESPSNSGGFVEVALPPGLWDAIEAMARLEGVTPFVVLLAAWQAWLGVRTHSRDVVVATPVVQRELPELEHLAGLFLTTLPIRTWVGPGATLTSLLDQVRRQVADALAHAAVPMSRLSALVRSPAEREALHQCAFTLVDQPPALFRLPGTRSEPRVCGDSAAKFALALVVGVNPAGGRVAQLEYGARFSGTRARGLAAEFLEFLTRAVESPGAALQAAEPSAKKTGHRHQTVPVRFAEQVLRNPDAEALVSGERRWTYAELDAVSTALAAELVEAGVTTGGPVGLHLGRSAEWVVAALAILKAGGVYVPLPPEWPESRLRDLVDAAGVRLILGSGSAAAEWLPMGVRIINATLRRPAPDLPKWVPPADLHSESPAYVLFTSGSTGKPKGVLVPHRAIHRLVVGQDYVPFGPGLRCLHLSSPAFDASTFDVWAPLLHGGTCVVLETDPLDAEVIGTAVAAHRVNCLFLTTGLFNVLVDERPGAISGVTDLLTGGEVLSEAHVRRALERFPGLRIVHCYGPTETTTFATAGLVPPLSEWHHGHPSAIGRELHGTRCEILDPAGHPVSPGEPGELWIGGDGVALGYVNDPELSAGRFQPDPGDPEGRSLRYRTGDQVRRLPDGRLLFLGRLDAQLKIRGHRVEPAEIEAILREHPSVRTAVVVGRRVEGGVLDLVACLQTVPGSAVPVQELRGRLAARLPEYMMPARFEEVESIPLTPTGKVDRAALADSALPVTAAPRSVQGPRTPEEEILCREWERVLQRSPVGIHDNFFELGGQSLRALQLTGRLQRVLGRPVRVADLFRHPTIAELAAILDPQAANAKPVQGPFRGAATGVPWFHVPGVFGFEFLTPELASVVGTHRPYFDGLQYPGLDGHGEPLTCVEAIAGSLESQIAAIYPEGPLWLSGYSFGGEVAYELARRFRERGRVVECVVLFDTCTPGAIRRRPLPEFVRWVAGQGPRAAGRLAMRKLSEGTRWLLRRARRRRWTARERVEAASLVAHLGFRPQPYEGRVVLLQSSLPVPDHTGFWILDDRNGWGPFEGPGFERIPLACDHHRVFLEPVAPVVLDAVRALLSGDRFGASAWFPGRGKF